MGAVSDATIDPRYRPPVGHLIKPKATIPADTPDGQAARMEALRWARIHRAREDFAAFMEYCIEDSEIGGPVTLQWFHDEWIEALETHPRVLILAPRSHGKSVVVISRMVWELGRNPNLRIKLACEDQTAAVKRLGEVKRHIERNPRVREVFPHLKPGGSGDAWSKTQIFVRRTLIDKEPSVEAQGVLGGATGGRADLLIFDDIVGRRNALTTPALRKSVKQALYSDWINLGGPECRMWGIATLWHREDANHELMENDEWHTCFYAIDGYATIWPTRRSSEWLRERRNIIGSIEYARGFANKPQDDSESPVSPDWIEFVRPEAMPPIDELEVYISYDVATEIAEHNDYTAETVIAIHQKTETVFVVDAEKRKVTRNKQSSWVQSSYHKWRPTRILIETIGNDLADWVLNDAPHLVGIVEKVKNLSTKGSKLQRLTAITPFLERGNVVFLNHLDPEDLSFNPERGSLVEELLDFGISSHDDMCLAPGTLIATTRGVIPIEKVIMGDYVFTPIGPRRVKWSGITGFGKTITAHGLTGTPNHKLFDHSRGFVALDALTQSSELDRLSLWNLINWIYRIRRTPRRVLNSTEEHSRGWAGRNIITSARRTPTRAEKTPRDYTLQYGKKSTVKSLKRGCAFITSMAIPITTLLIIWSAFRIRSMLVLPKEIARKCLKILNGRVPWLRNGTDRMRAERGTGSTPRGRSRDTNQHVSSAVKNFWPATRGRSYVPTIVGTITDERSDITTEPEGASYVAGSFRQYSQQIRRKLPTRAVIPVGQLLPMKTESPVYNLTVEEAGCFYANGVLVSNCDSLTQALDAARYYALDRWAARGATLVARASSGTKLQPEEMDVHEEEGY